MAKKKTKKPPSKERYHRENPTFTIRLTPEIKTKLDQLKGLKNMSYTDIIRDMLNAHLGGGEIDVIKRQREDLQEELENTEKELEEEKRSLAKIRKEQRDADDHINKRFAELLEKEEENEKLVREYRELKKEVKEKKQRIEELQKQQVEINTLCGVIREDPEKLKEAKPYFEKFENGEEEYQRIWDTEGEGEGELQPTCFTTQIPA